MPRPKRRVGDIESEHDGDVGMSRFTEALGDVLSVSKGELDRRVAEHRRKRRRKKRG